MRAQDTLGRYGVDVDELVECGFSLIEGEVSTERQRELKERFATMLKKNLEDPNISLMIEAASHLEGLVSTAGEAAYALADDPAALVADELIGMSIAEYIAGKRGLFNYVRYDRAKPGVLGRLPPFMDDAVGALVAATMTRLFEE